MPSNEPSCRSVAGNPRRHPHQAGEHLAKGATVAIADLPCHLIDALTGELEQFAGLGHTQLLAVLGRLHAGGGAKAAQEGALAQAGAGSHPGQSGISHRRALQPVLHGQHRCITVIETGHEAAELTLRLTVEIDHQKARGFRRDGRPQQARHQCQAQVVQAIRPPAVIRSPSSTTIRSGSTRTSG